MIRPKHISSSISKRCISFVVLLCAVCAYGQKRMVEPETTDTVPFLQGFAVSFDLAGAIQEAVSDYGQFEGAFRINLKDKYFPIVEAGIGKADQDNAVSKISYKSTTPYFRVGMDVNLMKMKHDVNRIYGGIRYAFSSFKYDIHHPGPMDPVWGGTGDYNLEDVQCNYHWAEFVAGVDSKIWGPLHLGWSVRYRRRIAHDDGSLGNVWYVPGFGKAGSTRLGGTFNIIIDI